MTIQEQSFNETFLDRRKKMREENVLHVEDMDKIANLIKSKIGVDIKNRSRKEIVVFGRKAFCYIARKRFTFMDISRYIGYDHATVMHHCTEMNNLLTYDNEWKDMYYKVIGKPTIKVDRDYFDLYIGMIG